jgi:hypothetical protein
MFFPGRNFGLSGDFINHNLGGIRMGPPDTCQPGVSAHLSPLSPYFLPTLVQLWFILFSFNHLPLFLSVHLFFSFFRVSMPSFQSFSWFSLRSLYIHLLDYVIFLCLLTYSFFLVHCVVHPVILFCFLSLSLYSLYSSFSILGSFQRFITSFAFCVSFPFH